MRLLLLLLALLAACPVAQAQLLPAAMPAVLGPPANPTALPAPPDTAAALHRLFAQGQRRSQSTLKLGGAMLLGGGLTAAISPGFEGFQRLGVLVAGVVVATSSVPVIASGLVNNAAYSKKHEQRALLAWQQHRLPRRLKRALEDDSLLATQAQLARAAALAALGPVAATAAALDTAAALHRLYAAKRRVLRVLLPLTLAVSTGSILIVATRPSSYGSAEAVVLGPTALLAAAGEFAILRRYSKKHEDLALLALREHRLPAPQRQELKWEYFRPAKAMP
jgi:hypothetical protein